MLILIAESKTMLPGEKNVEKQQFAAHTPICETLADEIMESLKDLTVGELMEQTGLSASLAVKMQKMIYEFSFKATGNMAIEAYTGVVFKALDYTSLSDEAKGRCINKVRIISSLYGWLRPDDIVKTYRLDFTTRLEEGPSAARTMNTFWRTEVSKCLVKALQSQDCNSILNLLPADAAKCIDWKTVKRFAKVWKVDFSEMREGGIMKTPNAGRLKTLRGYLLRQILEEDIKDPQGLLHTASPHYVCEGTPKYPDHLSFLC